MSNSELTADDARRMASRSGNKYVAEFEGLIERAAKDGKRSVLLCYTDCNADEHAAISVFERRGFSIVRRNENVGGTMQHPAYYAEW